MRRLLLASFAVLALVFVTGCPAKNPKKMVNVLDGAPDEDGATPDLCTELAPKERGFEACANGCDDDGDDFVDCDEFDCKGVGSCPTKDGTSCAGTSAPDENTAELCDDGCDNNADGFVDCNDFGCQGIGKCIQENSNTTCSDGLDNDGNGFIDCEDNGCTFCVQNSKTMTCNVLRVCASESTNAQCSDGMDNDGDTKIDCADENCNREDIVVCAGGAAVAPLPAAGAWAALVATKCSNSMDDDTDTFQDCLDFDCQASVPACYRVDENNNAACSDGDDNDFDGKVDCADPGCQKGEAIVVCNGTTPVAEGSRDVPNTRCGDGVTNNDTNTFVDCDDFSCTDDPSVTVCGETTREEGEAQCGDGVDNDGNGYVDCDDLNCLSYSKSLMKYLGTEACAVIPKP